MDNYVTSDKSNQLTLGQALTPITVRASVSISTSAQDHLGLREFAARRMGDAFRNIEDAIVLLGKVRSDGRWGQSVHMCSDPLGVIHSRIHPTPTA